MAKLHRGRLNGVWGMSKFTAKELHTLADEYEREIDNPENQDDPKWLKRRADKLRKLAVKKEKALEHKSRQ